MTENFAFIETRSLRSRIELGKFGEASLRKQLPSPIYWFRSPGGRKVLWNWILVRDYLLNGDSHDHQKLVEKYLLSVSCENLRSLVSNSTPKLDTRCNRRSKVG
jgi:hypothetical protein